MATARKALEAAADADVQATELASQAREVTALVADLAATTASYLADLDADPVRLEWVASRRAQLQGLTRKYGETVAEVLEWSAASATRLTSLQASDDRIEALAHDVAVLTERIEASEQTLAWLEADGRLGVYDFTGDQYFSWIRAPRVLVRGERGEINGTTVRRLLDARTPVTETLERRDAGQDGNLEGHHHIGYL